MEHRVAQHTPRAVGHRLRLRAVDIVEFPNEAFDVCLLGEVGLVRKHKIARRGAHRRAKRPRLVRLQDHPACERLERVYVLGRREDFRQTLLLLFGHPLLGEGYERLVRRACGFPP